MRYLSPEWFAAAGDAIQADAGLRELSSHIDLTIEQTVLDGPDLTSGPSSRLGPVCWHLVLADASPRLVVGPATDADLRFTTSYPVARAIAEGELAASIAFIRGELRVGGDLSLLTTHHRALAALDDVLHDVRAATTFAEA